VDDATRVRSSRESKQSSQDEIVVLAMVNGHELQAEQMKRILVQTTRIQTRYPL